MVLCLTSQTLSLISYISIYCSVILDCIYAFSLVILRDYLQILSN